MYIFQIMRALVYTFFDFFKLMLLGIILTNHDLVVLPFSLLIILLTKHKVIKISYFSSKTSLMSTGIVSLLCASENTSRFINKKINIAILGTIALVLKTIHVKQITSNVLFVWAYVKR